MLTSELLPVASDTTLNETNKIGWRNLDMYFRVDQGFIGENTFIDSYIITIASSLIPFAVKSTIHLIHKRNLKYFKASKDFQPFNFIDHMQPFETEAEA